ncbi:MAG: copper resistance protein CopC [Anaerolineae bacterium]
MKHKRLIALGAILLTLAAFGVASAHAKLDHCTPAVSATVAAAPAQVGCIYSEEIDTKQSTMSIWNASGSQVDKKDAHVDLNDADHQTLIVSLDPANVQNGLYTVKWHAVTPDDGGVSDGTWQFIIGSASATPFPPTEVVQADTPAAGTPAAASTSSATNSPAATETPLVTATVAKPTATSPATSPTTGGGVDYGWVVYVLLGAALLLGGVILVLRRR